MVFVVITEAAQGSCSLQARGDFVTAEELALGRRRAGLEVWQRKHGILESSAYPCPELDQTIPCVPLDVPITSLGVRHRQAMPGEWHEVQGDICCSSHSC